MTEPTGHPGPTEHPGRQAYQARTEFVRAFVEYVGPRPASERLTVRLPALVTITAVAAAGALLVGLFWHLIRPGDSASPPVGAPPRHPAPNSYTAVTGWDCPGTEDRGFEATGRTAQWRTAAVGGWRQDGCRGGFASLPLAGVASPGQAARNDQAEPGGQWWFLPGTGVRRCQISVYVPASDTSADTATTAARYEVLAGRNGTAYANFVVNQAANRGRWVVGGTFPVNQGQLAVRLADPGKPGKPTERAALAQVKLDCVR